MPRNFLRNNNSSCDKGYDWGLEIHHMTESFSTLRVNADRMHDSFIHLASIGATGDGGLSRLVSWSLLGSKIGQTTLIGSYL